MTSTRIILDIHGKRAEMTLAEAKEMLKQLQAVFGESPAVVTLPVGVSPTEVPDPPPWLPKVWCGPVIRESFGSLSGAATYDLLARN